MILEWLIVLNVAKINNQIAVVEQNESEDVIELISNNQFQGIYIGQSFQ